MPYPPETIRAARIPVPVGLVLAALQGTHRHFPNLLDCRPIFVRRALDAAGLRVAAARVERMWVPVEIVMGVSE